MARLKPCPFHLAGVCLGGDAIKKQVLRVAQDDKVIS